MSEVATVLVPARNEVGDIEDCLGAIVAQTYRPLEVIVVDGGSTDGTGARARAVLDAAAAADERLTVKVLQNPEGSTPSNLNRGLAEAAGEILCRVDARSLVPPDYVARCVALLSSRSDVAVVGGAQVAAARGSDDRERGIARALNNRWGMGLARYRRAAGSGESDTVYLGAFRTGELRKVGGWRLDYPTNQDFELNRRMAEHGVVWFESGLLVGYRPRQGLADLFRQYHRFGRWKVRYWRLEHERPQPRQMVLLALPVVGLLALATFLRLGPRGRVAALASTATGLTAFEVRGPIGPQGPAAVHAWSLVGSTVVAVGWTTGVWRELLAGGAGDSP